MIRKWKETDGERLSEIEGKAFSKNECHSGDYYKEKSGDSNFTGIVSADDNDNAASYGVYHSFRGQAMVDALATDENYRRQGRATLVLEGLIAEAKEQGRKCLRLAVRKSNTAAIALYEKSGFRLVYELPLYFTNDDGTKETAYIMRKNL